MLRLAMAHRDEVVELWQSPGHGGEGWHHLVAYPGRVTGEFQVRQGSVQLCKLGWQSWVMPRQLRTPGQLRLMLCLCHPHPPIGSSSSP